ncbi:MAG: hypothetical protein RR068_16000 [Hafnia sp.]
MTICELKQRTRLSEWRTAIQQQKASGQSIKQWCEENNCGEGKYYYWLKQVRQEMLEQGSASTVALVQFEPERLPVAAMETSRNLRPSGSSRNAHAEISDPSDRQHSHSLWKSLRRTA